MTFPDRGQAVSDLRPHLLIPSALPPSIWGQNLRAALTQQGWASYKERALAHRPRACLICGAAADLEGHEDWGFDPARGWVVLLQVTWLCRRCHEVRHWGRTAAHGGLPRMLAHIKRVNGWNDLQVRTALEAAGETLTQRSQRRWTVQMGPGRPHLILRPEVGGTVWAAPLDAEALRLLRHVQQQSRRMPQGIRIAVGAEHLRLYPLTGVAGVPAEQVQGSHLNGDDLQMLARSDFTGELLVDPEQIGGYVHTAQGMSWLRPVPIDFDALPDT